ncbi:hypothetical protein P4610_27600 [Niallia taxi]|nr:hypothetical protein [Niallia taxi]
MLVSHLIVTSDLYRYPDTLNEYIVGLFPYRYRQSDAYQVLTIISDAAFYFLPFLLAISAAKRFKVSEYLAVALAGALLYPTITAGVASGESGLKFLGMSVPFIGYSATVIPPPKGYVTSSQTSSLLFNLLQECCSLMHKYPI